MSIFNSFKKYYRAAISRYYYYLFVVKPRRESNVNALRSRLDIKNVNIQQITDQQWAAIKRRFRGFKVDRRWFDCYNTAYKSLGVDHIHDVTKVIPGMVFYPYIDALFSHPLEALTLSDKNFTDLLFPDVRKPITVIRFSDGLFMDTQYDVITKKDAYDRCRKAGKIIVKPSAHSGGGHGITFWDVETDGDTVLDDLFVDGRYYVVQEVLRQHERMNELHAGSVNTIRLETFLWKNEVKLLSCMVRMGANDSKVDNLCSGGCSCGINIEDGRLCSRTCDFNHLDVVRKESPDGCVFDGFIIPSWDRCVSLVKKAAPRFARISKLIAWDLAVAEDGEPVLIECNLMYSGCEGLQFDNGPLFGDLTDEVLDYVRVNKRKRFR